MKRKVPDEVRETKHELWDPLAQLSLQQGELLDHIAAGENIVLEALPGCGKSTFLCQIAAAFPDRNILIISYNNALVKSTNALLASIVQRQHTKSFLLCKTYHGLLKSLTDQCTKDDILFGKVMNGEHFRSLIKTWTYRDFDMLYIDEGQDKRRPYFIEMVELLGTAHPDRSRVRMGVLGDALQLIYSFFAINKADARYLTLADKIYSHKLISGPWHRATFDVSFRNTPQMANFLNVLVPERKMVSGNPSRITDWVTMYVCDVYRDAAGIVYDIIKRERREHALHKIVILAPSMNERSPVRSVVDLLVANGIPIHVDRSGKLTSSQISGDDDDVRRNKVHARTDASSKGLTYEVTIKLNPTELVAANGMVRAKYVSLSRPNTRLYLLQSAAYIDQREIDHLCKSLTQRDLRIIMKREVAAERKRKSNEEKGTMVTKNSVDAESLFAFLDVTHMNELLEHIESEPIIVGLAEEEPEGEEQGTAYSRMTTYTFDSGETHMSLLSICSLALQFALEVWFHGSMPSVVNDALHKVRGQDTKSQIMQKFLYEALDDIGLATKDTLNLSQERKDGLWIKMESFAKMAVVIDALQGYREMLHFINQFDFVKNEFVQRRFYALCENLQYLLADKGMLHWGKEVVSRFVDEGAPLQLIVKPAIVDAEKSVLVYFSTGMVTSYEDRLIAITSGLAIKTNGRVKDMAVYVVNLTDTSVEQVKLVSDDEQERIEDAALAEELGEELAQLAPRRKTCSFLNLAVHYKLLPREEEDEEEKEIASTQEFLAQAHRDIDRVLEAPENKVVDVFQGVKVGEVPNFEEDE